MGALRSSSASACGWPPGFGSSAQRGAQARCAHLCCRQPRSFRGTDGVAAFPGGAGSGVNPRPTSKATEKGLSA
ncbi:hypothetical protein [Pectobacterium sp. CFBP8739]|uniref:hypothetical protein n=1 Tax=Pectobacterium sp. CFBP8739 TaxID=2748908 RepID=UPI0015DD94BC|nr:hypothetical protein [Pectobacterium sp. CFBP8739]MBA0168483.1 hypothetical protein [Pectobacterium sp. CFBP8739]